MNSTLFLLFVTISSATAANLYDDCGTSNVVCYGSRQAKQVKGSGGCIAEKNCQVFVKIIAPDMESNEIAGNTNPKLNKFKWQLAVEYDNSTKSEHYSNSLYLRVTKKEVRTMRPFIEPNIPYYSYEETITPMYDHFEPRIQTCETKNEKKSCESHTLTRKQARRYIRFNAMTPTNFDDSEVNYMLATGSSRQVLSVIYNNYINKVDLVNDKVVVSVYHWHSNGDKSSQWYLGNQIGKGVGPEYLFPKMKLKLSERKSDENEVAGGMKQIKDVVQVDGNYHFKAVQKHSAN